MKYLVCLYGYQHHTLDPVAIREYYSDALDLAIRRAKGFDGCCKIYSQSDESGVLEWMHDIDSSGERYPAKS